MQKWISYSFTPLSRDNITSSKWIILWAVSSWGLIYNNPGSQACSQIKHLLFLFWFHTNSNTATTSGLCMCGHRYSYMYTRMNSSLLYSLLFFLCHFKLAIINSAFGISQQRVRRGLKVLCCHLAGLLHHSCLNVFIGLKMLLGTHWDLQTWLSVTKI